MEEGEGDDLERKEAQQSSSPRWFLLVFLTFWSSFQRGIDCGIEEWYGEFGSSFSAQTKYSFVPSWFEHVELTSSLFFLPSSSPPSQTSQSTGQAPAPS